jgi:uncharacterized protein (TIGR02171 family)
MVLSRMQAVGDSHETSSWVLNGRLRMKLAEQRFLRSCVAAVVGLALWLTCSPTAPHKESQSPRSYPGMRKIAAAGKSFLQGAGDSLATPDQKPAFLSKFTDDYWIDTTEVTQAEYRSVTGRSPVADTSTAGSDPNDPVYNVSWYDAAAFCNARSRREALDTVYTYSGIQRAASGAIYEMTGLQIRFDRNGYRLPTEAEWEFAARNGSSDLPFASPADSVMAPQYAWFAANSGGHTHPVASLLPNALGLYDMAGNVFEWTNDWKGPYSAAAVTNSLGAQWPDNDFDRVAKGGSFLHGFAYLRPSGRSTTYPTTLSSAVPYMGFRCAAGPISSGSYLNTDTIGVSTNPVSLLQGDLRPLVGSANAKLVFVNVTGNLHTLCVVDFGLPHPYVREFTDQTSVYTPTISPDGRFVAFATRDEGLGGPDRILVRRLDSLGAAPVDLGVDSGYVPRWSVDTAAAETSLVYTTSAIDNGLAWWPATQTLLQRMSGGKPVGAPAVLIADGGFHDGLSAGRQYAATGYTRFLMRELSSGQQRQLFQYPQNGKDSTGSTQVCNVSISPSRVHPDRCTFLDFGSTTPSTITGSAYGLHQIIFMADFTGTVLSWIPSPPGESEWNYPEWSNQEEFEIAVGVHGSSSDIYLVDLTTGASSMIASGIYIQHPWLWIAAPPPVQTSLDLDSLGFYNDPPLLDEQAALASKLHFFWLQHDQCEIVVLGDSRAADGVDPWSMPSYPTFNLAYIGGDLAGMNILLHDYVLPHCSEVRMVIMNLRLGSLALNPDGDVTWNEGTAQSTGFLYDLNHGFWASGLPPFFDQLVTRAPFTEPDPVDSLGMVALPACAGWGAPQTTATWDISWDTSDANCQANLATLRTMAADAAARGVHVLFVNMPVSPAYATCDNYYPEGPSQQTARELIGWLDRLAAQNAYFHFYDANNYGVHDYTDDDAFENSHLCLTGANKLSARLDSIARTILNP